MVTRNLPAVPVTQGRPALIFSNPQIPSNRHPYALTGLVFGILYYVYMRTYVEHNKVNETVKHYQMWLIASSYEFDQKQNWAKCL
ncbi:hypothetical protein [Dyadobacter bucti]|uniref:hypothetical protein n=1 Tax=Dyadobacter bucti TaxID=2572203 RepID=UPI003F71095D